MKGNFKMARKRTVEGFIIDIFEKKVAQCVVLLMLFVFVCFLAGSNQAMDFVKSMHNLIEFAGSVTLSLFILYILSSITKYFK